MLLCGCNILEGPKDFSPVHYDRFLYRSVSKDEKYIVGSRTDLLNYCSKRCIIYGQYIPANKTYLVSLEEIGGIFEGTKLANLLNIKSHQIQFKIMMGWEYNPLPPP